MFNLLQNISLKSYNTFGISVNAQYFVSIENASDLKIFFGNYPDLPKEKKLILGGGSNLLFLSDFNGLIIYPQIKGIRVVKETAETVEVEVGAGEVWDDFVAYCVENGWGGVENLSLIPGNIGAVPVQNIGAYGVEVESSILRVNTINLVDFNERIFTHKECHFGYRESIFKGKLKDLYLISSVVFLLKKKYSLNFSYGALKNELMKTGEINLNNLRKAVISIRESKLPDPRIIGNAGSFFKNPIVTAEKSKQLTEKYPDLPIYPCSDSHFKTSAAWLIDKAGWKGKAFRSAAVHEKQALVIVNKGDATGRDIYELSQQIRADVYSRFGIMLEPEVNIIGEC